MKKRYSWEKTFHRVALGFLGVMVLGLYFTVALFVSDSAASIQTPVAGVESKAVLKEAVIEAPSIFSECKAYVDQIEERLGIPRHLLSAIMQVESGRWNPKSKKAEPWPWSVNVRGKSHYFSSKAEALTFIKDLDRRGVKNFDVGYAQINNQHRGAFSSLSAMLDPATNIAYAGEMLKKNFARKSSWQTAVKYYHSGKAVFNIPYQKKVYRAWEGFKKNAGKSA